MKKLVLASLAFISIATYAQYENVYFKDVQFENENVKVEFTDIVALPKEVKFKMTIINKTNNYLIYDSNESSFVIPDKTVTSSEKNLLIEPLKTKKRVMRATGDALNSVRNFKYICEGFSSISLQDPAKVERFRLPASVNEFSAGNFKVNLVASSKETQKTSVKFAITYIGDNLGFVFPSKVSAVMPDGTSYATANADEDALIMKKGESENMTLNWTRMPGGKVNDMQLVEMFLTFEGVFAEGVSKKINGGSVEVTWDEALTEAKK
jgi:hypothetical protein